MFDKLSLIETGSDNIERLKQSYDEKLSEFNKMAENLSLERQKAACILDKMIKKNLTFKNERARLKQIATDSPRSWQRQRCVYYFPNPGSKFDPLMKIASGN